MQLMNKCRVNVSNDSIKTLLDFLVYTRDDSDHLWNVRTPLFSTAVLCNNVCHDVKGNIVW